MLLSETIKYGVNKSEIKRIAKHNQYLTEGEVGNIINNILHELHAKVNLYLMRWILRFVPKMTGALRRDLLMHIRETIVKNHIIYFYIQTNLEYAIRVNKMPTRAVRHRGKKVEYKNREYTLWDPQAIGHFFDKLESYAFKIIPIQLRKIKNKFARKTKLKYREMNITLQ
ncbi:hypothetical protein LCGC14_1413280 [marine sediment metagenome]|uniref:Uncharacterized protein n=1 Tax=marine sediment metagenome TaxID=412755 RepID=A0A0F9M8Z8_9ZZZZ